MSTTAVAQRPTAAEAIAAAERYRDAVAAILAAKEAAVETATELLHVIESGSYARCFHAVTSEAQGLLHDIQKDDEEFGVIAHLHQDAKDFVELVKFAVADEEGGDDA